MDFSKVKEWFIPEGKVKSVSIDGVVVWQKPTEGTYTVSGTWYFNETLTLPDTSFYQFFDRYFTFSNGYSDTGFYIKPDEVTLRDRATNNATMYTKNGGWSKHNGEPYRTITFDGVQTVSKEFYEWFTANAVRQIITFTIGGTTYYADKNMTWGEWVESEYNVPYNEGGTLHPWGIMKVEGSYTGDRTEVPIGAIWRSSHAGAGGYAVMRNGSFAMSDATIEAVAYDAVSIARN